MAEVPEHTVCIECISGEPLAATEYVVARRVFSPPAAIHFHGPGFYSTDVKGTLHRRRRRNAGDDLHREFQADTAKIADAI